MSRAAGIRLASGAMGLSIGVFTVTAVHALAYAPDSSAAPALQKLEVPFTASANTPIRIRIPSIGVDANIESLGLTASGAMAAPARFSDAGWYRYGAAPGAAGTAVIAGHLDDGLGLSGVFKRIDMLRPGDEIEITAQNGAEQKFVVLSAQEYPYTKVPDQALFTTSGPPRLALITCAGSLLYMKRTYDRRLVVLAKPASPTLSQL